MSLSSLIGYAAAGLAIYFYKKSADEQAGRDQDKIDHQAYINTLLDDISDLQDIVNPNKNADGAPITVTALAVMGGLTLNQLEIWLNIRNDSTYDIEIGDMRANLFVGGIRSERVKPSNVSHYIIPAGKTVRVRFYARGNEAFPGNYLEVRRVLAEMCRSTGTKIPSNTVIPVTERPVELDLDYLWFVKGEKKECHLFDIPGAFEYKYAGWTVGGFEGYNAGRKNQQKLNPSYWEKYDGQGE